MRLTFHGAAGTVTGSRHLLEAAGRRLLVDCGMFQGLKELRLRNWRDPGFDPAFLDAIILTHAHLDHSGYLPRLRKYAFSAPIFATPATAELLELILMDSAHIQEEDAKWANKKGFSKHQPAEPLYTSEEALEALALVAPLSFGHWHELSPEVRFRLGNSGHILGAAFVEVRVREPAAGLAGTAAGDDRVNPGETTVVYSGDLGRYAVPLHSDPEPLPACDVLVIESTYGARKHPLEPILDQIRTEFDRTLHKRGIVLIPSFAIGRAQMITLILRDLMREGELAELPIHIDSPMAVDATAIYSRHLYDCNLDAQITEDGRSRLFPFKVHLHRTTHESKQLNAMRGPRVIVAASGMMVGGRILHHLVHRLPDHHNLVLISGYQAVGTRGRALQDGARSLHIHGQDVPVRAHVVTVEGLSSHADGDGILRWIHTAERRPRRVFVVHGEEDQSQKLAARIGRDLGCAVDVPELGDSFDLGED